MPSRSNASGCPEFRRSAIARRELLKIGALGLTGLSLSQWLRAAAQAQVARGSGGSPAAGGIRSVILFQHYGAPSHIDTWDPKPDAPPEIRGEFGAIATSIPGYFVSDQMPRIAPLCDRFTIVRSMTHRVANHNPATYLALTGRTSTSDIVQVAATGSDWPAFGSVVSALNPGDRHMPPFVSLPHVAYDQVYRCPGQWGGILGKRFDPLIIERNPNSPDFNVEELSLPAELPLERLDDRRSLLEVVDRQIRGAEQNLRYRGMDEYYDRAWAILTSDEAKNAFDINQEDPRTRERYGRHKVGQSLLLARRLVEAGVRFVTCFSGAHPGDQDAWDTHAQNFPRLRDRLIPPDDQAFSALISDLEDRGLLDSTLVIWSGEFGRNPKIGIAGPTNLIEPGGRDHWPFCYTIVLAGGGAKRGYVYSSSDRHGEYPAERAASPADFAATLFWALGIDPHSHVHDQLGRPIMLAEGNAIPDLFG